MSRVEDVEDSYLLRLRLPIVQSLKKSSVVVIELIGLCGRKSRLLLLLHMRSDAPANSIIIQSFQQL